MLGGGFLLILLIIFGVVIYINLHSAPAVEMWDRAMEDYRSGSYPQAMKGFEDFLDDYSEDDNASEARVRITFCKIRAVIGNPQKALERAKELLPPISEEPSFPIARPELARPWGWLRRESRPYSWSIGPLRSVVYRQNMM